MKAQKAMTPDKPFFVYFPTGGVHAPHHVQREWADKYAGKFDQGWDKLREETLARQLENGVVPEGTVLALKPEEVDDWDSHSAEERKLYARQAEFFAGQQRIPLVAHRVSVPRLSENPNRPLPRA